MATPKEGKKAPAFSAEASDGKKHSLKDYRGKTIVLYFYPRDLTPGCTTEAKDFQKALTKFKKKNTVILGVSRDPMTKHEKFKDKLGLKFPLLEDEDGKLCKSYGVWQKKKFMGREFMGIVRTTFVIDPKGTIAKIFPQVKVKGHVDDVLKSIG